VGKEKILQALTDLIRAVGRLFPDGSEERAHRARMLMAAGLTFVIVGMLISVLQVILWLHPTFPPPPSVDLVLDVLVMLVGGLTVWLLRSERVRSAVWVVLGCLWIVAIIQLGAEGCPSNNLAGGLGLFLVVVMAFVLLNRRAAWLVFFVSAASLVGVHVLWLGDRLPQPVYRDRSSQVLFSILTWLAISGVIAAVISSTMEALREHRERLEEMVEERTAQLRRSEEKLRAQYKGIPVPTYTWQKVGEELVLVDYNDAAAAITQGKIADFVGVKAYEMHWDMPEILDDLWRCLDESITIERVMSYRLKSTGESKYLAVKYAFVPPDLVLVHTEDITERKEMQKRLLRSEKLVVLGRLAGGVGHELRNPLGAIKNAAYFLRMILAERELDPEVEETLGILEREVNRSECIIGDLLDFARARPPVRRKVVLNDVVQESLSSAKIPEGVEAVEQLDEGLPAILADPEQLDQALGNLIHNAVQAMPDGGRLVVQTEREDREWLTVSIADTGVGIPEENLEKIFEPLFTTRARGIGLGLAIVKTLVEGHGGEIEVESAVGEGSTFTVRLPVEGGSKERGRE